MIKEKQETFSLYWEGSENESGKAYYKRDWGEFVLAINVFPNTPYYLKAIEETEERIRYRVETILKRGKRFIKRPPVGSGFFDKSGNKIIINLAPFEKCLVLDLGGTT